MQHSLRALWADQRGIVLVLALILMGLLSALAAAYAMMIRADTVLRGAAGRERRGFYAAEAGLNVVMAQTRNQVNNYQAPGAGTGTMTVGSGALQRIVDYSVTPDPTCFPCARQPIAAGQAFAGLNSTPYRYQVSATAENAAGDEEATLGAQFVVHEVPIFQFLAFSKDNLFIAPGSLMSLHGRVHTNGDLYLSPTNTTISIGDLQPTMSYVQVSAAKNVYRGANKPGEGGQQCIGTVIIDKLADIVAPTPDLDPQTLACVGNGSSPVPQATLNAYLGSLLAGVNSMQLPQMGSLARGGGGASGGGTFWQKADLRIVLRLDLPRIAVQFANFCPATVTTPAAQNIPVGSELFPIEVQNADGTRNVNKTNSLWTFMCQRRGAIFYNDIPNGAVAGVPDDALAINRVSYTPPFGGGTNGRVYRQAGEDTNGDGIVDNNHNGVTTNSDRNWSICPVTVNGAPAAARPWWVMDDCPWPFTATTVPPLPPTSWYLDTDYRRGGFYNRREGKWIYMLDVNLRALIDWNEANGGPLFTPGDSSDGGLVFFLSVQGPNSNAAANNYGVRIFDSADLNTRGGTFALPAPIDPTGLTVVSDQAVYIEGNYNTKDKYPAAVVGDAINVLSQGWEVRFNNTQRNDRKSVNGINVRVVPDSDNDDGVAPCGGGLACGSFLGNNALGINAALISGLGFAVEGPGVYNGGLENYLRFHESWVNKRLNYQGSFVTLDKSQHQLNDWSCATPACFNAVYVAPDRYWDYDTSFDKVEGLPPLTPMVTYVQQAWYTRFYK